MKVFDQGGPGGSKQTSDEAHEAVVRNLARSDHYMTKLTNYTRIRTRDVWMNTCR